MTIYLHISTMMRRSANSSRKRAGLAPASLPRQHTNAASASNVPCASTSMADAAGMPLPSQAQRATAPSQSAATSTLSARARREKTMAAFMGAVSGVRVAPVEPDPNQPPQTEPVSAAPRAAPPAPLTAATHGPQKPASAQAARPSEKQATEASVPHLPDARYDVAALQQQLGPWPASIEVASTQIKELLQDSTSHPATSSAAAPDLGTCQRLQAVVAALVAGAAGSKPTSHNDQWMLLDLCCSCWAACVDLLVTSSDMATATSTSAGQAVMPAAEFLHGLASELWALSGMDAICSIQDDMTVMDQAHGLSQQRMELLTHMVEAGKAWLDAGEPDMADWFYSKLRQQLSAIADAATDIADSSLRQEASLLQFHILLGSLECAAQHGHQALWGNLLARMQHLLDSPVLSATDALSMCISLSQKLLQLAANRKQVQAVKVLEGAVGMIARCHARSARAADDEGASNVLLQLADIRSQVVHALGHAYLAAGDPDSALSCAQEALNDQQDRADTGEAISLAVRALFAQGHAQAAKEQLLEWLQGGCLTAAAACKGLEAYIVAGVESAHDSTAQAVHAAKTSAKQLKPQRTAVAHADLCEVVVAALQAFPGERAIARLVLDRLLMLEADAVHSLDVDELIMQLLSTKTILQSIIKLPQEDRQKCHGMLHARALQHYDAGHFQAASRLLAPALFCAGASGQGTKSARLLGGCCIQMQEYARAVEYVAVCEQQDPHDPLAKLLRLQALLKQGSIEQACTAAAALPKLAMSAHSPILQAAVQECLMAAKPHLAWCLIQAWREAAQGSTAQSDGLALLMAQVQIWDSLQHQQQQVEGSVEQDAFALPTRAAMLSQIAAVASTVTGGQPGTLQPPRPNTVQDKQLAALAGAVAALGVAAMELKDTESAAPLMLASCRLHEACAVAPASDTSDRTPRDKSLAHARIPVLLVLAALRLKSYDGKDSRPLVQGRQLLEAAQQLLTTSSMADTDWQQRQHRHLQQLEFVAATYECDAAKQKVVLQALASSTGTTAAEMAQMADVCSKAGSPWHSPGTANVAYGHMLRLAGAAKPVPDICAMAEAVRGLFEHGASHTARLKGCQRIIEVLQQQLEQHAQAMKPPQQQQQQQHAPGSIALASCGPHQAQWLQNACLDAAEHLQDSQPESARAYLAVVKQLQGLAGSYVPGGSGKQGARPLHPPGATDERYLALHSKLAIISCSHSSTSSRPNASKDKQSADSSQHGDTAGDGKESSDDADGSVCSEHSQSGMDLAEPPAEQVVAMLASDAEDGTDGTPAAHGNDMDVCIASTPSEAMPGDASGAAFAPTADATADSTDDHAEAGQQAAGTGDGGALPNVLEQCARSPGPGTAGVEEDPPIDMAAAAPAAAEATGPNVPAAGHEPVVGCAAAGHEQAANDTDAVVAANSTAAGADSQTVQEQDDQRVQQALMNSTAVTAPAVPHSATVATEMDMDSTDGPQQQHTPASVMREPAGLGGAQPSTPLATAGSVVPAIGRAAAVAPAVVPQSLVFGQSAGNALETAATRGTALAGEGDGVVVPDSGGASDAAAEWGADDVDQLSLADSLQ